MPNIGVVCPPISGHLNPAAVLGRSLRRRGHSVTVFQVPSLKKRVEKEGLDFRGLGPQDDDLAVMIDRMGRMQGLKSLRFAVQGACRLANIICQYGPEAIRQSGIDLLLVDQNEPAGGSVAEHLGLPFLSLCPSLPLNREAAIPPPFVPWSYSDTPWAKLRNRLGYAASDRLIAPIQKVLNGHRAKWGLSALRSPDDSFSRLAQLSQMPRDFDFPRRHLPETFHYLGPFVDDATTPVPFPFEKIDGRPLVFASLGTLQSGGGAFFLRFAEACAALDVQLVMATGTAIEEPGKFPGDPIVVSYAPQLEILKHASVTVTHAGLNTVMQSLLRGVPMVALPMTHDQPAIAARLARTGAGLVFPPAQATADVLRGAIGRVLKEPQFRQAAARLQTAIAHAGGVERGADIVEKILQPDHALRNR